jgi:hypothetical protein
MAVHRELLFVELTPRDPASATRPIHDYMVLLDRGIRGLRVGVIHHFHEVDHPVSEGASAASTLHSPPSANWRGAPRGAAFAAAGLGGLRLPDLDHRAQGGL